MYSENSADIVVLPLPPFPTNAILIDISVTGSFSYCKFVAIMCYTAHMHNELETVFAKEGYRLTSPRRAVFDVLHSSESPLAIAVIIKACPDVDRVSIYRTLELFTRLGITEIIPFGWKQRYELTSPFKPHHHHLYCTNCGILIDIH
ncbi:transcriptional repressor, partial [archaeon]